MIAALALAALALWCAAATFFAFGFAVGRRLRPAASQVTYKAGLEAGYAAGINDGRRQADRLLRQADALLADIEAA